MTDNTLISTFISATYAIKRESRRNAFLMLIRSKWPIFSWLPPEVSSIILPKENLQKNTLLLPLLPTLKSERAGWTW